MTKITVTELRRNLRSVLERLVADGEEVVIERNHHEVARLVPARAQQTALEALTDLYGTLREEAAATWGRESRSGRWRGGRLNRGIRDPWAS